MSLANYGDLKTQVAAYLNRIDLAGYIPDMIRLGEQRIFYGSDDPYPSQPLRIPAMMAQETGTITNSAIAFPTRFLEPIALKASSGGNTYSLSYVPVERFDQNSSGLPSVYTYRNNQIQTAGTGSASYILDYYQAFATLASDSDTNWVLTNTPGVYLWASLLESAPFLMDDARIASWFGLYKSAISSVNRSTKRQGTGLAARVVT